VQLWERGAPNGGGGAAERRKADISKVGFGWIVLKKSVEPNSTGQIIRI